MAFADQVMGRTSGRPNRLRKVHLAKGRQRPLWVRSGSRYSVKHWSAPTPRADMGFVKDTGSARDRKMPAAVLPLRHDGQNTRVFFADSTPASCPAPFAKIFAFLKIRKHDLTGAVPRSQEGASRSSRTSRAGCDGRVVIAGERYRCVRSSRVVLSPRRWGQADRVMRFRPCGRNAVIDQRRWLTSPRHRGERGAAVKPSRRECRVISAYLW